MFYACKPTVSEIGSDFFNNNTFDISYIDSVTLKVSTVQGDSFSTSSSSRLLVGFHDDEKLGTITSQAVFQVGITVPVMLTRSTTAYQSLKLYLKRDRYSYYDTTQAQTIYAYRLTKQPVLFNNFLYNTSKFSYDPGSPLGSATFLPHPLKGDSLEISLPDALGQEIMEMAWNNDQRLRTNEDFLKFINGFALIPDTTQSRAFLGFRADATVMPELRLYYEDQTTAPATNRFIRFRLNTNIFFNKIHTWRDGTSLAGLKKTNDEVSSNDSNHEGYFQAGGGLQMRVEMPYLRNLLFNDRNFRCSKAILELMPLNSSYKTDPLPIGLSVYAVNEQNKLLTTASTAARLVKDIDLGRNTRYQVDVTAFVNSQIQNDITNKNALLVLLDDASYRSSVSRLYFGDKRNPQFDMKIKLYYLTLPIQTN